VKRETFIFYRSFYESIKEVPEEDRLKVYETVIEYALNGSSKGIRQLKGIAKAIFTLIKPQLDANLTRYLNSLSPKKNQKQSVSESEAKPKRKRSETGAKRKRNGSETEAKWKRNRSETGAKPKRNRSEMEAKPKLI